MRWVQTRTAWRRGMPRTSSRLLVFARAPVPGAAKTRLIPTLGAEGAAALQARLIKHTLSTARRAGLQTELHGTPAHDDFLRFCAERYQVELIEQSNGDLGARMHAALAQAFTTAERVILIGTDCPALTATHIRRALTALEEAPHTFVPTEDGGYALVGASELQPVIFENMPWSTDRVMAETRRRLSAASARWSELETLWDVDREADWRRLETSGLLSAPA